MTDCIITEAASTDLTALESEEPEPLYVLFDQGVFERCVAKPLILDPVLATNDLDAIKWLSESLGYPTIIAAMMPEGMEQCLIESAITSTVSAARSMADSGFVTLSGLIENKHLRRITPTDDDLIESIVDVLETTIGSSWAPTKSRTHKGITSWIAASSDGRTAVVLSDGYEIRPWRLCLPEAIGSVETEGLASWEIAGIDTFWRTTQNEAWGQTDELILEYARKNTSSTMRLKRVVMDALVANKDLPGKLRDVTVTGNKMTLKVGRRTYWFTIERDPDGWVTKVIFERPKGREADVEFVKKAIKEGFKEASFHQVLEDACSGKKPKLVMLDYILQEPSKTGHARRRTRLVEPYSFRRKYSKNRRYFYGWNVEEGGIRSYIVENIQGVRKTDVDFRPRFVVEIGAAKRLRAGTAYPVKKGIPATVSDAAIKRGHERYELAGGRGKIIRRLGHSVAAPKPKAKKTAEAKK